MIYIQENETNTKGTDSEFCSFSDNASLMSYSYFGIDIFNLYSREELTSLIRNPIENNKILREISRILYGCNGTLTNTIDYMVSMLTLDKVVVPHGTNVKSNKKNTDLMNSTLRIIRDKEVIRDIIFNVLIDGTTVSCFETTTSKPLNKTMSDYDISRIVEINNLGVNASIKTLPIDYCQIVGTKNSSYVVAFDLKYFTDFVGESTEKKLMKYPEEIRKAFKKKQSSGSSNDWVVLDNTKTIVHKIRSSRSEKWGRPLVLAAIKNILYSDYFTDTKRNILDEINNNIFYQTFPEGKDKGTSSLSSKQQKEQHEAVKGAVINKNARGQTSFFSVAAGTKLNKLEPSDTDLFDSKYESNLNDTISLDLGIAGSLLNGSGSGNYSSQQTNLELLSSQLFQWMEQIQNELNKVIAHNIIKDDDNRVEVYYLPITHVNKKNMIANAKELYLQGKGSLSLWASACGIPSDVFFAMLDREVAEDIENKYPVHKTSFTLSNKDEEKSSGAPTKEDSTNPSTIQSRSNNSNNIPKPSSN